MNIVESQNRHYKINDSYNGNIPGYSSIELGINGSYEDFDDIPQIINISMTESVIIISSKDDDIKNKSTEDTGEIGIAYFKEIENCNDVNFAEDGFYFAKNQILLTAVDNVSFNQMTKFDLDIIYQIIKQ